MTSFKEMMTKCENCDSLLKRQLLQQQYVLLQKPIICDR